MGDIFRDYFVINLLMDFKNTKETQKDKQLSSIYVILFWPQFPFDPHQLKNILTLLDNIQFC